MKKRKTYTSPEVKNRWNAAHYDRVQLNLPKGGAAEATAGGEPRKRRGGNAPGKLWGDRTQSAAA